MKICYTVCSLNRVGQVLVLFNSIRKYNADYRFILCLADEINGRVSDALFDGMEVLTFKELQVSEKEELSARYNIFELSCALKAYFGNYIYQNHHPNILLYFDTDIKVYQSLTVIEETLKQASVILTPHYSCPMPDSDKFPLERDVLNSGLYNGGFIGMKRSETAKQFLTWWQQRLQTQGYNNVCKGMMVDQLWLNLVPLFFTETVIVNDACCNTAYWNLHERKLTEKDGKYFVNNNPLVFFHFSGYRIDQPKRLSLHQNRIKEEENQAIQKLLDGYHQDLSQHEFERYLSIPPLYGTKAAKKKIPFFKKMLIDTLAKAGYTLQPIRKV